MKAKMKETIEAYPDGINPKTYEEGKVYDLPEHLAKPWIKRGVALKHSEKKASKSAPENKAIKGAPENKNKEGKKK